MRMNKYIVNTPCPPDNARLLSGHCSRAFWDHIRRAAVPAVMLAVAVVLETGCSSTGAGFRPLLIRGTLPAATAEFPARGERLESTPAAPGV
jgi:hypothetical protein